MSAALSAIIVDCAFVKEIPKVSFWAVFIHLRRFCTYLCTQLVITPHLSAGRVHGGLVHPFVRVMA